MIIKQDELSTFLLKIYIENGIQEIDFVIDMDGNLQIGRGHSYLANGKSVQAAITQAMNYPDLFRSAGIIVDNAWIRVNDISASMSNYVINTDMFYDGSVQYMPR